MLPSCSGREERENSGRFMALGHAPGAINRTNVAEDCRKPREPRDMDGLEHEKAPNINGLEHERTPARPHEPGSYPFPPR